MKIVLTTVGTLGDIKPFAVLGRALARNGHSVRACSYSMFEQEFAGAGIEFVPIDDRSPQAIRRTAIEAGKQKNLLKQVEILRDFHLEKGDQQYHACYSATEGFDLAVCHANHSIGQAAVMDKGVPWICVLLEPGLIRSDFYPPTGLPNLGKFVNRLLWNFAESMFSRIDPLLKGLLESVGSRQKDIKMFRTRSDLLNLLACSNQLYEPQADFPADYRITGFWSPEEEAFDPPAGLSDFLDGNEQYLVVSLGSMTDRESERISRLLVEAVESSRVAAVIQTNKDSLSPASVSDSIYFADYIPHDFLLSNAICMVHHGGAGTTAAACRSGIPSVIIPHIGDQFYWANRLHELGLSPKPISISRLNARNLTKRIRQVVTTDRFKQKASQISRAMNEENGLEEAVRLIEKIDL